VIRKQPNELNLLVPWLIYCSPVRWTFYVNAYFILLYISVDI
jgi:hypothetical protein